MMPISSCLRMPVCFVESLHQNVHAVLYIGGWYSAGASFDKTY